MKLEDALKSYINSGIYPFHMPGHKRNPSFLPNGEFFRLDLTELEVTDDLHSPDGILLSAMRRAAEVFRARQTYFSVGGSTVGLLSAIYAMTHRGDKILLARNCHRSVYHAVCLNGLSPVYVMPPELESFGFCGSITAESIEKAFEDDPDIKLAVITSPTYEGVISDIPSIAKAVHRHGALLLVDSAHGAHLGFDENFPASAIEQGADVVVQSLHKTLHCFTQTALVHICTDISCDISGALKMYETSSPSYLFMCGIDNCVSLLSEGGKELFSEYSKRLENFYSGCKAFKRLRIFTEDDKIFSRDPSKIVISTRGTNTNGKELYYTLKDRYKLQFEAYMPDSVLAITSICDTDEGFERLLSALSKIDGRLESRPVQIRHTELLAPKTVLEPYKALEMEKVSVPLEDSAGETAGGFIYAYPPGIPIIAAGERISGDAIRKISELTAAGVNMQGSGLSKNGKINVIQTKKSP